MQNAKDIPIPRYISVTYIGRLLGVSRQCADQMINPEKHRARSLLHYAVKTCRVAVADACEECGDADSKLQGHHPDYSKPLDVKWLCRTCHVDEHRNDRRYAHWVGTENGKRYIETLPAIIREKLIEAGLYP